MTTDRGPRAGQDPGPPLHVPPGHHYSPIPSVADVERAISRARATGPGLPGVALRDAEQLALLDRLLACYDPQDVPDQPLAGRRYYAENTWFTSGDAICYAMMLRHLRPARVVEVGAGFSSALALDVAQDHLGEVDFTFVDPDPQRLRELLRPTELRLVRAAPVQDVPLEVFTALQDGDILFIDSSHCLRPGSDVAFLLSEILPRLAPGVYLHFHDIFWPFEYPDDWLRAGVSFTEAYAVRQLLTAPSGYELVLWNSYLARFHRPWLVRNMPLVLAGRFRTGGIWVRKALGTTGRSEGGGWIPGSP